MISHRYFYGFAIFAFLMSLTFLGGGISLLVVGSHQSNQLIPLSLLWNGFGILGSWLGANAKLQTERLDNLEAELRQRNSN